jgi:hypothetical protein
MKLIALRGKVKTGKTTVIDIVYHFLIRDGYIQFPGEFRSIGPSRSQCFVDCLTWNTIKVGISNTGNYQSGKNSMQSLITKFEELQCNMMIIDCLQDSGNEKLIANYKNHAFVEKTEERDISLIRITNVHDAEEIIKRLYYTINVWRDFA